MRQKTNNYSRGFTLLEILIALLIFTIVSLILTSALHTVITTQANSDQKARQLARMQIALLSLSRDLEQAIDRPILRPNNTEEGFIGTEDALTFTHAGYSNPEGELPRSSLQRVKYHLEKNHLIRTTWPLLDQTVHSKAERRQLLDEVSQIEISYLDQANHFQHQWPTNDPNKTALPKAVKITLTLKKWGTLTQLYLLPVS